MDSNQYLISIREGFDGATGFARRYLPRDMRAVRFLIVGATGLVVNNLALAAFTELLGLHYLLSAVVATQVSTLWNFVLTEAWVFGDRREGGSLLRRLGPFWLMNNILLALRGPILTLMVSAAGIHYILANLISLGAITLLRYLLADHWIWAKSSPAETASAATATSESRVVAPERRGSSVVAAPTGKTFPFAYDVHGIVQIESMVRLPELDYFRVSGTFQNADLRIWQDKRRRSRRAAPATPRSAHRDQRRQQRRAEADMHYEDGPGRYGFEVAITYKERTEIATSPLLKLSPHVLYTNVVEPILRWTFVRKGHALCHAACVSFGGQGVLITARTDTGKTTTILRSLTHHACVFLSDDMTIMGREGQVLSYPKPLTISRHTLRAVNAARLSLPERMALQVQSLLHSRSGRQIGLLLGQTKIPAASLNAIVQMIIPPPKYMVDRLVTNVKVADGAYLTNMILIERGPSLQESLGHHEAVEVLVRNGEDAYGFPPYPALAGFLSKWNGEDLRRYERAIISEGLWGCTRTRLRDPNYSWWERLPSIIKTQSAGSVAQFQPASLSASTAVL